MDYQDMLAKIGLGSAHPGGFSSTLEFLSQFPFAEGSRILEVGCGTGRTACFLAKKGYQVTAIDIRPAMIAKAKVRAQYEGVDVEWMEGDACNLPFEENQFDIVFIESVTVFAGVEESLSEYYRVLRSGGRLFDREMMAMVPLPQEILSEVRGLYKVKDVKTQDEWLETLGNIGYKNIGIWNPISVKQEMSTPKQEDYDPYQQLDEDAYDNPDVWEIMMLNAQVMTRFADWLGFGVLMGTKP